MRRYFGEFNRVVGDNIRASIRRLRRRGVETDRLPHKTALVLERPDDMSWSEFSDAVTSVLHPKRGSVMLSSESTGRTFICQNRGNRPGRLVRQ
jgi:hypothetical protein